MQIPRVLRSRILVVALVLMALAPIGGTSALAAQSAAPSTVTFGVQPSSVTKTDGRPFFTFGATPGSRLTDHVAFLNYSLVPIRVKVYATDALNTVEGGFALLQAKQKPVDAGSWITLGSRHPFLVVPARRSKNSPPGQVIIPVTMTVPATASPGDHGAGIIASLSTVSKNAQGANIVLDQRVATRVYVRVAGQVRPKLAIENLSATYHGTLNPFGRGFATVTYTVRNKGNVKLGGQQAVEVSGLFGGTEQAPKMADIPLLFPGSSIQVSVEVPGVLPSFRLTATASVVPLMLSGDVDPGLAVKLSESVDFWGIPWPLIAVGLLLVLLAGAWWYRRRHRTAPEAPAERELPKSAALLSLLLLFTFGGLALAAAPSAHADTVGYSDSSSVGTIGLCDKDGKLVTSGNINDHPFAFTAVSSEAADAPYNGKGGKATLLAYQPREGVIPGRWSGDALTASSTYTNPRHPMSAGTLRDFSLADFMAEFPARWDGLLQLRMYLSAPDAAALKLPYPSTDIRVSGDTWSVVRGGTGDCGAGKATSNEVAIFGTAPPSPTTTAGASGHGATPTATPGASHAVGSSASPSGATLAAGSVDPAADTAPVDRHLPIVLGGAFVVLLALAGFGYSSWRERPTDV